MTGSGRLSAWDLVTHDAAQPTAPAVQVDGGAVLSYGELAALVGAAERALRHEGKALVLCAGDRDLPTVLAYLAALRLGHTVAFLPATPGILGAYEPEFVVSAHDDLTGLGYRPVAPPIAGAAILRRERARPGAAPSGEIFAETALLLATSGSTGSPKTVRLSYSGLAGNTAAVIRTLGITAAERALTTPTACPC
jgi:acyl-coenzyme A synthetase/AMP-(fatty) acid ligase